MEPPETMSVLQRFTQSAVRATFEPPGSHNRLTPANIHSVDRSAGVYALYDDGKLFCICETGCLQKRLLGLFRRRKHTCRRTLEKRLFSHRADFHTASTQDPSHLVSA